MRKHPFVTGLTLGLSLALAGCAGDPKQNALLTEAQMVYDEIKDDPSVARSAATQLRSASKKLEEAKALLADDADDPAVDHAAYLAKRHGEIAREQGRRSQFEAEVTTAEERRKQLELQQRTAEADALRQQMEAMQAQQTERGMVLTLGDVLFDVGKADLKPAAERTISRLAQFMLEYPARRVLIEGYTDSTGDDAFNQMLSLQRANSVRDALVVQGVTGNRIDTRGYGESYPVANNDSAAGRQQNRRVEIVISDESGNIDSR